MSNISQYLVDLLFSVMITRMRFSEAPFLSDWFVISFRWLCLLGLAIAIILVSQMAVIPGLILLVMALWNIYVSLLAILNRRLSAHRIINMSIDMVGTLVLFGLTNGAQGPLVWVGLLVFSTAGIYYGMLASLLVGISYTLLQGAINLAIAPEVGTLNAMGLVFLFNILTSMGLGFAGSRLISWARNIYRGQVRLPAEIERKAREQERDRMQAFYDLTTTLSATLNYQTVLNTALDLGAKAMDDHPESAEKMVSAFLLFDEDQLKVGQSRRMGPTDQRVVLPGSSGIVARALHNAEPQSTHEPSADPELGRFASLQNCRSCACVALRSGLNVFGIFLFAHPEPYYFNPGRLEILDVMTRQAVVAIQNALLYQDLALEQKRIIETQDEARRKLARDLHDGPIQSVAAIAMRVNYTRRLVEKDPKATTEELVKIEDLARRTTNEIRHMLFTLRPLVLESRGLVAALCAMAEKMKETFDQNVLVEGDEAVIGQLEISKQTVIFYICEEAVNNARKHAQAAHIWVRLKLLSKEQELALLEIQDDGVGFDVEAVNTSYEQRESLGMVNLRERAELVNGLLQIQSAPGQGTRIQVFIPLTEEAADHLRNAV
jgi:signal transduction histidine kinase